MFSVEMRKLIVLKKRTTANRMNTTTRSSQIPVLLHQIDKQLHGVRLEIDISVESEKIRVFSHNLFAVNSDGQLHQTVAEEIVHVHDLNIG